MRLIFTKKVADLSADDFGNLQRTPLDDDHQSFGLVVRQHEGQKTNFTLNGHAPGLHSFKAYDSETGSILALSFASIKTPHGSIGVVGSNEEEALNSLSSTLLLAGSPGSGAELATGEPAVTPAARAEIRRVLHPETTQALG